jgi:uncharacterized Zn finger protein
MSNDRAFIVCPSCGRTMAIRVPGLDEIHEQHNRELVIAAQLDKRIIRCLSCKTVSRVEVDPPLPADVTIRLTEYRPEMADSEEPE